MVIRKLETADVPAIIEMVFHYRKVEFDKDIPESKKGDIEIALRKIMKKRGSFPLVFVDKNGGVEGYILYHILDYPIIMGKEDYISDLLIRVDARGNGIVSSLLGHAERHTERVRCTRLMLNNPKEGVSYKRDFYMKHGYTKRTNFANIIKLIK